MLDSFNLVQHVSEKTHANGHTLDLVISNAIDHFVNDVKTSDPVISDHLAVNNYDEVLRSLLDKYAPVKERLITVRPFAPWYTAEVTAEKQKQRRLECKWRASRLPADR